MDVPIPGSYRVADRLLAGEYPGAADPAEARRRLQAFAAHGIGVFVDLTHPTDLLPPYWPLLVPPARRLSQPIVDLGTTSVPHMTGILDDVDAALARGDSVYVHCWGGVGRTGTVVGCWLVRHGLDEGDPIARLAALRAALPGGLSSPETRAQQTMVAAWTRGR